MPSFTSSMYITATRDRVWEAITSPEWTRQWYFDTLVESSWQVGAPVVYRRGNATLFDGIVLEVNAPSQLVTTFAAKFHPEARHERPSRMTWRLLALGEDVKLSVTYDDIDEGSAIETLVKDGLAYPLNNLKYILETGRRPPVANVVFDCADHARLAQFWSQVTGYVLDGMGDDWAALHDPRGVGPRLLFYRVPESKTVKNRVHLDISVADRAAAEEQFQALGGRRMEAVSGFGLTWTVMADPEGNEFCIA
ncbi:MAG TPA: VOC family protein [Chloroflexota bacterium]